MEEKPNWPAGSEELQHDLKLTARLLVHSEFCRNWESPDHINDSNNLGWDTEGLKTATKLGMKNLEHQKHKYTNLGFKRLLEIFTLAESNVYKSVKDMAKDIGISIEETKHLIRIGNQARENLSKYS